MSVKLRLRRMGNTNRPFYRVVAIDSRKRRDGRALQELGYYDPLKEPAVVSLKEEPILEWLNKGAEPSETVKELLRGHGILLKWKLLRAGASLEEATQQVATALETRVVKTKKQRPSKKELAKMAAKEAKAAEASAEASSDAESTSTAGAE